jgi:hypothetical protein
MCSYPRVNGAYACENPSTLGTLKTDLGFGGFVMSDWGATWRVRPGIYKVAVGSSSRDIRATGRFTVPRQHGSLRGS